ncbi:hypothetical protein WAI453_010442 [Rhynchosporium graminicola]
MENGERVGSVNVSRATRVHRPIRSSQSVHSVGSQRVTDNLRSRNPGTTVQISIGNRVPCTVYRDSNSSVINIADPKCPMIRCPE